MLMLSPQNGQAALEKLEAVLRAIVRETPIFTSMPAMEKPEQAMSMGDAILQTGEILPLSQCVGRILASPSVSCPPAIPVVVCGERIDQGAVAVMDYYGITQLCVI